MSRLLYLLPLSLFLTPFQASAQDTDALKDALQQLDKNLPNHFVVTEVKTATRTVTKYVLEERTEEYTLSVPYREYRWRWRGKCWIRTCVILFRSETRTRTVKIRKPVREQVEYRYRVTRNISPPPTDDRRLYSATQTTVELGQLKAAVGPTFTRMAAHFDNASRPTYGKPKRGNGESFVILSDWAYNPDDATKTVLVQVLVTPRRPNKVGVTVRGWHINRSTDVGRVTNSSWKTKNDSLRSFIKRELDEIQGGFTKTE